MSFLIKLVVDVCLFLPIYLKNNDTCKSKKMDKIIDLEKEYASLNVRLQLLAHIAARPEPQGTAFQARCPAFWDAVISINNFLCCIFYK